MGKGLESDLKRWWIFCREVERREHFRLKKGRKQL